MENSPAYLYLCGRGSCDSIKVNRALIELYDAGLFRSLFGIEKTFETIFKMHESRACICPVNLQIRLYEESTEKIGVTDTFSTVKQFIKNCDKPIVAVPVHLTVEWTKGPNGVVEYHDSQHANILIIDRKRKTIEIFEPHGVSTMFENRMYNAIEKMDKVWHAFGPKTFTVTTSEAMCPAIKFNTNNGPQAASIDDNGSCTLWSLWFLHVRLQNPHMSGKEAQEHALESILSKANNKEEVSIALKRFISGFATTLMIILDISITESEKYYKCKKSIPGSPGKLQYPRNDPLLQIEGNIEIGECVPMSNVMLSSGSTQLVRREVPGFIDVGDHPDNNWGTLGDMWANDDNAPGTTYKHLRFPMPLPKYDPLGGNDDDDDDAPIVLAPKKKKKRRQTKSRSSRDDDDAPIVLAPKKKKKRRQTKSRSSRDDDDAPIVLAPKKKKKKRRQTISRSSRDDDDAPIVLAPKKKKKQRQTKPRSRYAGVTVDDISVGDIVYWEDTDADMFGTFIRKINDTQIEVDITIMPIDNVCWDTGEAGEVYYDYEDELGPIMIVHVDLITRVEKKNTT
jgi:hypothetical protein